MWTAAQGCTFFTCESPTYLLLLSASQSHTAVLGLQTSVSYSLYTLSYSVYSTLPQQYTCLPFLLKHTYLLYDFTFSIVFCNGSYFHAVCFRLLILAQRELKLDKRIKCCLYVSCAGCALLILYSVPWIRSLTVICTLICTLIYTQAHSKFNGKHKAMPSQSSRKWWVLHMLEQTAISYFCTLTQSRRVIQSYQVKIGLSNPYM